VEIIFANNAKAILDYTDCVLTCDIHTRARSKRLLKEAGAKVVLGLDDIMTAPINGSGYNEKYGLLGSNKSTEDQIKLFPRDCQPLVEEIQKRVFDASAVLVFVAEKGKLTFGSELKHLFKGYGGEYLGYLRSAALLCSLLGNALKSCGLLFRLFRLGTLDAS
jgi:hypothetical protein